MTAKRLYVSRVPCPADEKDYAPAYNCMMELDDDHKIIALWREITITERGKCCIHTNDAPTKNHIVKGVDIEELIKTGAKRAQAYQLNNYEHGSRRMLPMDSDDEFSEEEAVPDINVAELEARIMTLEARVNQLENVEEENTKLKQEISELRMEYEALYKKHCEFSSVSLADAWREMEVEKRLSDENKRLLIRLQSVMHQNEGLLKRVRELAPLDRRPPHKLVRTDGGYLPIDVSTLGEEIPPPHPEQTEVEKIQDEQA